MTDTPEPTNTAEVLESMAATADVADPELAEAIARAEAARNGAEQHVVVLERATRTLTVFLGDADLVKIMRDCIGLRRSRTEEENRQKLERDRGKERLLSIDNRIAELEEKLVRASGQRDVAVVTLANYDEGIATVVREDTGEVLDTRPLTPDERQLRLEPEVAEAAAAAMVEHAES